MLTLTKLPWVSLTLLVTAYSTLGWVVYNAHAPWFVWLLLVFSVALVVEGLVVPWSRIRRYLAIVLKSDVRAFGFSVLGAFLAFVIVAWLHIFVHALVILASNMLVRLNLQEAGVQKQQTFWILFIFSIAGIGVGAIAEIFMSRIFGQ